MSLSPVTCGCGAAHAINARVAVVTLSDSRQATEDRSGDWIVNALVEAGHTISHRLWLTDDPQPLQQALSRFIADPDLDAIITTGGTGIAPRDNAIGVIESMLDVVLPGFGEYFRSLSIAEVGVNAMLSRATAGRAGRVCVFALPGSTGAVRTAMTHCVLPIMPHAISLASGEKK